MSVNINQLIGKKIGRLRVVKEVGRYVLPSGKSLRKVECKCECGNVIEIILNALTRSRPTVSCGCFAKEVSHVNNTTHGLKSHNLYRKFWGMITRCYNPKYDNYSRYGGRGIKICDEWLYDFEAFYHWSIENGWKPGLQIDRINTDGNYEPSNCRYVSAKLNNRNRSISKLDDATVQDIRNTKLLIPEILHKELATAFGLHPSTIGEILRYEIWN